jgi:hypothetical protein
MNDLPDIRHDLEPGTPDELIQLAERLRDARPLPKPAFRGELRRRLVARSEHLVAPPRLRVLITRYAAAGTALLIVGAVSAAGAGPLG